MVKRLIAFSLVLLLLFPPERAHPSIRPDEVLIVVNRREPISARVADYYRTRRKVPDRNVCPIECTTQEVITAAEFTSNIKAPIEEYLRKHFGSDPASPGKDPIKVILLTYGIPSRIDQGERCSSVDSALALSFNRTPWGRLPIARYCDIESAVPNPYYGSMLTFGDMRADARANDIVETPPSYTIVRFLDENIALAGGFHGLLCRGERIGNEWTFTPLADEKKGFIAYRVSDIFVLDSMHVWACTGEEEGQGGSVIYSEDGGKNWRLMKTARTRGIGFVLPDAFYGVAFADEKTGWVVGRWQTRTGAGPRIEKTVDGIHWIDFSSKFDASFVPRGVSASDRNRIWICGSSGIYHSADGGATWTRQAQGSFFRIVIRKTNGRLDGWAVGAAGKILHTIDGISWEDASIAGFTEDLRDLSIAGGRMAAACGRGRFLIFDGQSWSVDNSDPDIPKTSIAIGKDGEMLAASGSSALRLKLEGTWQDGDVLPAAHWRLRYLVCRLDGFPSPITNREGVPDEIKAMIDRSLQTRPGGVFLLEEPRGSFGDRFYIEAERELKRIGAAVKRDASASVFQKEDDVMGYASFGMHDPDIRKKLIWGQPFHRWRPGAISIITESTDGRSLRRPLYCWGIGDGTVTDDPKIVVRNLPYEGYWIGLHDSGGRLLARADASAGLASIDIGGRAIRWPTDHRTSLQVHFPDKDPLHPGETLEHARYPHEIGAVDRRIYELAMKGKGLEFEFMGIRPLAADFIRSGASAATANVDEPFLAGSGDANRILPAYASGFTWAESAYMGFRVLSWKELAIGDPLMAPFAR